MRNIAKLCGLIAPTLKVNSDWLKLRDHESAKNEFLYACKGKGHRQIMQHSKTQPPLMANNITEIWDRFLGDYQPASTMRWVRFYDILVLTAHSANMLRAHGLVWLEDYEQWISEADYSTLDDRCKVDNDYYAECPGDVFYCEYTSQYYRENDMLRLADTDEYCSYDYANRNFYLWDDGDYRTEPEPDDNSPSENRERLKEYSTAVEDSLGFGSADQCLMLNNQPLYLGLELEIEADDDDNLGELLDFIPNWMMAKEDSSLDDNLGLELVTKPLGLQDQRINWASFISTVRRTSNAPDDNYGLHVHISKNCMSKVEQARIVKFVCNQSHRDFMVKLSRRGHVNNLARWCSIEENNITTDYFFSYRCPNKNVKSNTKYKAVNTSTDDTLEFRLFASTTNYIKIMEALEFCQSIAHYVVDTRKEVVHSIISLTRYAQWLEGKTSYEHIYKNLTEYLSSVNTSKTIAA